MLTETDFHDLMQDIVQDALPEEKLSFKLGGQARIHDLYTGSATKVQALPEGAGHAAGLSPSDILEYVKLLAATFTLLQTFVGFVSARKATATPEAFPEQWRAELLQAGLPSEKVEEIVGRWSSELTRRLEDKR